MAALSIANVVKTSLGPVGLDKMLVDDIGVIFYEFNFVRMLQFPMMEQLYLIYLRWSIQQAESWLS